MNSENCALLLRPAFRLRRGLLHNPCGEQYPFTFKLRKKRITKAGDFSCRKIVVPTITVNPDSPYLFVLTYVHEVAHLIVPQKPWWESLRAHGQIWKDTFAN